MKRKGKKRGKEEEEEEEENSREVCPRPNVKDKKRKGKEDNVCGREQKVWLWDSQCVYNYENVIENKVMETENRLKCVFSFDNS